MDVKGDKFPYNFLAKASYGTWNGTKTFIDTNFFSIFSQI